MKDQTKERWLQLCALTAQEDDPAKLLALVAEINRLLMEREQLLTASQSAEMRRTWREIAREVEREQLAISDELNQSLLERERRNVPRSMDWTTSAA